MERVDAIPQRLERPRRGVQRARRPAQIARGEGDLRLRRLTPGPLDPLARTERPRRALEQLARAIVLAELSHRDAAEGEGGRILTQRDALERAQRIAGRERARGRGDQGVHGGDGSSSAAARQPCSGQMGDGGRIARYGWVRPGFSWSMRLVDEVRGQVGAARRLRSQG